MNGTASFYSQGIGFHALGNSFSYLSYCLAEGLNDLGIPVYANRNGSNPLISSFSFSAATQAKLQETAMVVLDLDQLDTQIAGHGIQCNLPYERFVILAMNDNLASFSPPARIPLFCTHENRFHSIPGFRIPWAFGCSSHMLNKLQPSETPRKLRFVANFRPTHAQSLRQALDLTLVPLLRRHCEVDSSLSDPDRWGAAHFEKLRSSIGCLAYGGYFAQDLHKTPYLAKHHPGSPAIFHHDTVVLRWDNWRFWESLVAGCATVHLDLRKYGCLLPEMPENGVHYIGIDLEEIPATVALLTGPLERLQEIGEAGRHWALQQYSPVAVARRFLKSVVQPEQYRTELLSDREADLPERGVSPAGANTHRIIVDGVFFQYRTTGIARVWEDILHEWSTSGFARQLLVLDRDGTCPRINGIEYRRILRHDYQNLVADRQMLQHICNEVGARAFVSTYYTTPLTTPSALMIHDCIPEALGADLLEPTWQEKRHAIQYAAAFCTVSGNTASDLLRYYPQVAGRTVEIIHNGVSSSFYPASAENVASFCRQHGIARPYYLFVGPVEWYKNFRLFIEAFACMPKRELFQIVRTRMEDGDFTHSLCADTDTVITTGRLSSDELRAAYSGALALVYPSWYEGFGLPILEAMSCGCPVIAADTTSIPEVAGDAALLIPPHDHAAMLNALIAMQSGDERKKFRLAGLARVKSFNWQRSARRLQQFITGIGSMP